MPPGWRRAWAAMIDRFDIRELVPRLRSFLTTLTRRRSFEDSLDEEVRFHLDAQTEDLVRTGLPPEEAARRARERFGSIEAIKAECLWARGLWLTDELRQWMGGAIRPALRLLLRAPVVTRVARAAGMASSMRARSAWRGPKR